MRKNNKSLYYIYILIIAASSVFIIKNMLNSESHSLIKSSHTDIHTNKNKQTMSLEILLFFLPEKLVNLVNTSTVSYIFMFLSSLSLIYINNLLEVYDFRTCLLFSIV